MIALALRAVVYAAGLTTLALIVGCGAGLVLTTIGDMP